MSDDKVVGLNERRAIRDGDNAKWTVMDCASAFMRDVTSGEIRPDRVIILYEESMANGGKSIAVYSANVQRDTEIAMLHMRLHSATHKWQYHE